MPLTRLVLVLIAIAPAFSSAASSSGSQRIAPAVKAKNQSGITFSTLFSTASDLAEQTTPRRSNNSLDFTLGYMFNSDVAVASQLGLSYIALDGKPQEQTAGGYGKVEFDLDFAASVKTAYFPLLPLAFTGGVAVPTDEISRYEGVQAIPYTSVLASLEFFKRRLRIDNTATYRYIVNRFDTSVSGDSNPEASMDYKSAIKWLFKSGIYLGCGAGIRSTRYLDDFVGYSYNNTQVLGYRANHFFASLTHTNGGFVDKGEVNLWYVDIYRRLISFRVGYDF